MFSLGGKLWPTQTSSASTHLHRPRRKWCVPQSASPACPACSTPAQQQLSSQVRLVATQCHESAQSSNWQRYSRWPTTFAAGCPSALAAVCRLLHALPLVVQATWPQSPSVHIMPHTQGAQRRGRGGGCCSARTGTCPLTSMSISCRPASPRAMRVRMSYSQPVPSRQGVH